MRAQCRRVTAAHNPTSAATQAAANSWCGLVFVATASIESGTGPIRSLYCAGGAVKLAVPAGAALLVAPAISGEKAASICIAKCRTMGSVRFPRTPHDIHLWPSQSPV